MPKCNCGEVELESHIAMKYVEDEVKGDMVHSFQRCVDQNTLDVASDFAYDAAREDRFFR